MRDIEGIKRLLPLRYPYLMIDRIIEEVDGMVVAIKNVSIGEPFFQGHFPEPYRSVMPGTLILEAMAQTAAFLAPEKGEAGYLVGVEGARFRERVVPGDQLRLEARLLRWKGGLLRAKVDATVEGKPVASAEISLFIPPGKA